MLERRELAGGYHSFIVFVIDPADNGRQVQRISGAWWLETVFQVPGVRLLLAQHLPLQQIHNENTVDPGFRWLGIVQVLVFSVKLRGETVGRVNLMKGGADF